MVELHAICWRTNEPHAWVPAIAEHPGGSLPRGPFFWDHEEAVAALADLLERAAGETVSAVRTQDRDRHAREVERYEDAQSHIARPGVSVHVVGEKESGRSAPAPKPLKTEEEQLDAARRWVSDEWSIQTYEVPDHG